MASSRSNRTSSTVMPAPAHPVPQLQGPFEESMMESVIDGADHEANLDSYTRRTILLEKPQYERVVAGRWKQKPGERYHPLWKVVSQISFGLHLLAEGMARSEEEVMKILQTHVDDIDCFLERTTEDMELAQSDVSERLHYLKLPLQHVEVFDRMLEDRAFRISIVEGNEKIEHIVERTSEAMKDTLKDVQKGLDATKTLAQYLTELERTWQRTTPEHEAVFVAMLGNVEGWGRAFMDLHLHGNKLKKSLAQLSQIVTEMQRRAGVVSRKFLTQSRQSTRSSHLAGEGSLVSNGNRIYQSRDVRRPASAVAPSHKALPANPNDRKVRLAAPRPQSDDNRRGARSQQTAEKGSRQPMRQSTPGHDTGLHPTTLHHRSSKSPLHQATVPKQVNNAAPAQPEQAPPMELPADVPEEALRQAPLSKKSRLSLHLGLKGRDGGDPKSSHRLSAKGLGSLLKPAFAPHMVTTPNSTTSRATDASYTTARTSHADPEMGYFAGPDAHMAGSKEILEPVAERVPTSSLRVVPVRSMSSSPKASSPAVSSRTRSPAGPRSPAFTSHPPNMDMVTEATTPSKAPRKSSSAEPQKGRDATEEKADARASELGEPGPEIEVSEPVEDAAPTTKSLLTAVSTATTSSKESRGMDDRALVRAGSVTARLRHELPARDTANTKSIVAELDSVTPRASHEDLHGRFELAVPRHSFALPPRSSATQEVGEEDVAAEPVTTPGHTSLPPAAREHHLGSSRFERSSAPMLLRLARRDTPRTSQLHTSSIIDQLSDTPPGSPIHVRGLSDTSANSAQLYMDHRSRLSGIASEAPPPPPPGGRRMASVDYASANQFEGERKSKSQRHSAGSTTTGWKKFLSGRASPLSDGGPAARTNKAKDDAELPPHPDMMTAGGKDVLWFKGMGTNGLWVS